MKQQMGRHLSFVECRESMGLGAGGGLAARATLSESGRDVIAIAMGPSRRHITKPVCEITYALREEGIDTSVMVVNAGSGVPADAPDMTTGSCFGLDPIEVERIQQFKVALIHLGNVRLHIKTKAVMPPEEKIDTKGTIVEIVNGVVRGVTCSQDKLDEIVSKVQSMLPEREHR